MKEKWFQWQSHRCRGWNFKPQRMILSPWNLMEFSLLDFRLTWNLWPSFFFLFFLLEWKYLSCQSHYHILEEDNLFSGFEDLQMEKNFAPSWTIPSLTHDWFRCLDENLFHKNFKILWIKDIKKIQRQPPTK